LVGSRCVSFHSAAVSFCPDPPCRCSRIRGGLRTPVWAVVCARCGNSPSIRDTTRSWSVVQRRSSRPANASKQCTAMDGHARQQGHAVLCLTIAALCVPVVSPALRGVLQVGAVSSFLIISAIPVSGSNTTHIHTRTTPKRAAETDHKRIQQQRLPSASGKATHAEIPDALRSLLARG
jgi:hypothetical protein